MPASKYHPASGSPSVPPTSPPVDVETAARLRAVVGRLARRLRRTQSATAAGLTPTRISVLLHVVRAESVRLSELAAAEGINPTMLSRVVADLAEAGLLERVCDPTDRRSAWVTVTPAGRRLAERMRRERTDTLSLALAELPTSELSGLESALPALEHLADVLCERRDDALSPRRR